MTAPQPRPGILDIAPYVPGASDLPGAGRVIKISANEGALGPSPKAVAAYRKVARHLHRYPDGDATGLREAIGRRHGLDPARLVCGAGSDEILYNLARGFAGPGDEVLYSEHGFNIYPIVARSVGALPVKCAEPELRFHVDNALARVSEKTRIVFIANPNNPTGSCISADELARLRAELPDHVLLVIDAAYAEYVLRNDYTPGTELVDAGANVVMTRTFSKIYGLAALRLGWAYCPPAIADVLNRLRGPFNVGSAAQAAGVAAMADSGHLAASRDHNSTWLPWLTQRFRDAGLVVHPSAANFILVEFPDEGGRDAAAAMDHFNARGIIPRGTVGYGLPCCLRFTIGREDEMRAVARALAEFSGVSAPAAAEGRGHGRR